MVWRPNDPQCNEASKVKYDIVPYTRGRGLDIGCGQYKAYSHFIGVDNGHHWGTENIDVVTEADDLSLFADKSMDFVFSSHTLEHVVHPEKTLHEWWRVIKEGGYLVLYLPHKDLYPNIGEPGANPDHKSDFSPSDVRALMKRVGRFDLQVDEERNTDNGEGMPGNEYSFFQVYKKISGSKNILSCYFPKPKKTCCVVRYGGFGDMIQASSIFPGLKKQGYDITVMTTPRGKDVLAHDGHISDFIIQDSDQVPNHELSDYWAVFAKKFDKFINLSMSIEGNLLIIPSDFRNQWPKEAIHAGCNMNYLEHTHRIAGVPYEPAQRFYATQEELEWAASQIDKIGRPVVCWSLAGSATHKVSPFFDQVTARLLLETNAHIVFLGDQMCKLLEGDSWVNEPRVWCRSGEWTIRQSLVFAQMSALVIGSETGVMNGVAMESVGKVIMLSHSTIENLTRDWVNTISLVPEKTPCYPCHKLHHGAGSCPQTKVTLSDGEVFASACKAELDADKIYNAAIRLLGHENGNFKRNNVHAFTR